MGLEIGRWVSLLGHVSLVSALGLVHLKWFVGLIFLPSVQIIFFQRRSV